jgi:excisionase family DNA binding protein
MPRTKREPLAPLVYTITQTAERLGCSRDKVYSLIASGELVLVDLGGKPGILASSIEQLLARSVVR